MTDFLKDALAQVPAYLRAFPRVFAQPRSFGRDIAGETSKSTSGTKLSDALTFLAISLLITAVCKSAAFREAGVTGAYLAKDAVWKGFLVLAVAGMARLSWRIVGGTAPYDKYLVANCYYFGVLSVLVHLVLVIGNRAIGSIVHLPPSTFVLFYAVTIGPLLLWVLYCWRVYADMNGAVWKKSFLALFIFFVIGTPALVVGYGLRFALIGHVFRDWF